MKITYQWLRSYVDFPWSADELSERLTMLGLEVEGVEKRAGEFEGVVVAQVITRDKHPNADKLSVCRVNDGKGERQIVCGAQNFKAGDKVPLILPGATLPPKPGDASAAPFTIKVGKIRGVESHGMMCSAEELGLPAGEDGLLILSAEAAVGQPFAQHLGRSGSDVIYDLEVTPNRPDLNSVIGIAREIAALTGNPLRLPSVEIPAAAVSTAVVSDSVAVRIEAPDLCPRYTARVLRGIRIGPSPDWLRQTLEKTGVRSINNVVDVTNFVMLESGQPLHAFDLRQVAKDESGKPTVIVRRATANEPFQTLDGQQRTLSPDALLIADATKGIALAGVMGGRNSEIQEDTSDVLLESASFTPTGIRRTSKTLGLRTDASYRFERGSDVEICDWASARAARLILETAGGQVETGVVDAYPVRHEPKKIQLRHAKVGALLGVDVDPARQIAMLTSLDLRPLDASENGDSTEFSVPSFRVDLKRETDLIEEVARLFGVDKIPSTPPRVCLGSNPFDAVVDQHAEVRQLLCALGLNEAQGQTLIASESAKLATGAEAVVALANPLSSEMDALRPSLIPGLLDSLKHNSSRKNSDVALFEVGRVFQRSGGTVREERRLAIALTGLRCPRYWSGADRESKYNAYDLKGIVEEFLESFGLKGIAFTKRAERTALYHESAVIALGGKLALGELGLMHPMLAKTYDLRDPVLLAELNLDLLIARRNAARSFKPLPQFPSVRRDIALVVAESVTHDAVLNAVRQAKAANLESTELFDVFRGKHVPEGFKSVAYTFTYRHAERTLTDADVNAAHEKLTAHLTQQLGGSVR